MTGFVVSSCQHYHSIRRLTSIKYKKKTVIIFVFIFYEYFMKGSVSSQMIVDNLKTFQFTRLSIWSEKNTDFDLVEKNQKMFSIFNFL